MNEQAITNKEKAHEYVLAYKRGEMSLAELTVATKPILDEINAKAKEIAKKYNMKPRYVTLPTLIGNA